MEEITEEKVAASSPLALCSVFSPLTALCRAAGEIWFDLGRLGSGGRADQLLTGRLEVLEVSLGTTVNPKPPSMHPSECECVTLRL